LLSAQITKRRKVILFPPLRKIQGHQGRTVPRGKGWGPLQTRRSAPDITVPGSDHPV
jgi:hypothetical protein